MHIPRLFLAICAISFFWMIGAIVIATFPPLVKNILFADQRVASTLNALFSIGIAVGSVAINRMLRGRVSARFAPASVIAMGLLFVLFSTLMRAWPAPEPGHLYNWIEFAALPRTIPLVATLMAIAVTGGMFVVPLYAFLTTTVTSDQTARTVAANNVVNSGAMVVGAAYTRKAHATNERSSHAPKTSAEYKASHGAGCGWGLLFSAANHRQPIRRPRHGAPQSAGQRGKPRRCGEAGRGNKAEARQAGEEKNRPREEAGQIGVAEG
eukprot:gene15520-20566_t